MKRLALGIDIGGINTAFGLVDENGDLYADSVISTKKYPLFTDYPAYVAELTESMHAMADSLSFEYELVGVGIGAPNANYYTGNIESAVNISWGGNKTIPFAELLSTKLGGIKVALTNDANAAAVGEMTYGIAKGMKDFIMITLGTGVGSGIVINGNIVYGHDGFAGELGHTTTIRGGRQCNCGRKGCLETYTSATGVARTAREFLAERKDKSLLRSLDPEKITSKDIYDAATKGDKLAIEIFHYTGRIMGEAFANFVAFSAPEAIVLFGGLARAKEYLYQPIMDAMNANLLPLWRGKIKIVFSQLKESDAASLGASALAWEL